MKILLYITGSISCYKSIELSRELQKKGHIVAVVLSHGAEKFLKRELFKYLGIKYVYGPNDDFETTSEEIRHIDLSRWCDLFVVCPASANTISHLACGFTKDLGTTIFLALEKSKPKLIFPAMNTKMLSHQIIESNIEKLKLVPETIIFPTQSGVLACGEHGMGKLLELEKILPTVSNWPIKTSNKKVLISTGASIAPLDDVRYLTNPASGKTGFELAETFLSNGHQVDVISGIYSSSNFKNLQHHPQFKLHIGKTSVDYLELTKNLVTECDIFISAAAICDIEFPYSSGKIKKDQLEASIDIKKAPDVLKEALKNKREDQYFVGFAAESELTYEVLHKKWNSKKVDLLVGTEVNNGACENTSISGFQMDYANYKIFEKEEISIDQLMTKKDLSSLILSKAEKWLN